MERFTKSGGGTTLINGTGYKIAKGRTLVGGTGYDINFGITLGELTEGTIVYLNESGTPQPYYVAQHNYYSSLNGDGRTLLVRKETVDPGMTYQKAWSTYLAKTYPELLDSAIVTLAGTTKYNRVDYYEDDDDYYCLYVKTYSTTAFMLSISELRSDYTSNQAQTDGGSLLPIASTIISGSYQRLRNAYEDGVSSSKKKWAILRSTSVSGTAPITGAANSSSYPFHVCITLPAETSVNTNDYLITG